MKLMRRVRPEPDIFRSFRLDGAENCKRGAGQDVYKASIAPVSSILDNVSVGPIGCTRMVGGRSSGIFSDRPGCSSPPVT